MMPLYCACFRKVVCTPTNQNKTRPGLNEKSESQFSQVLNKIYSKMGFKASSRHLKYLKLQTSVPSSEKIQWHFPNEEHLQILNSFFVKGIQGKVKNVGKWKQYLMENLKIESCGLCSYVKTQDSKEISNQKVISHPLWLQSYVS